jgi:F-type H+-transporting ATPase subunit epsilon
MNIFKLEILSSFEVVFSGDVFSVSVPTNDGIIQVLPGHMNLIARLYEGSIIITTLNKNIENILVVDGFIEIIDNCVNIIAEFAIRSDKINKDKIKQAVNFANEIKSKKNRNIDIIFVESELKKLSLGLKINSNINKKNSYN